VLLSVTFIKDGYWPLVLACMAMHSTPHKKARRASGYDGLLSACMLVGSLMHESILGAGNYCLLFQHAYMLLTSRFDQALVTKCEKC
jgi:hypothetical protein